MKSKQLEGLKIKTIRGVIQLVFREATMKIIAILGQLLLVRLLAPSAFGTFAILSFIVSTAEIFTDIGLGLALIQKKEPLSQRQLSTIFYIKLLLTITVIAILNIGILFINIIYPQLTQAEGFMLRVMSLSLLINPIQSLIASLLERDLKYKEIAVIDLIGMLSYYAIAVIFAFSGFGIWSFIYAVIARSIVQGITTFIYNPWLPNFIFDYNGVRTVIKTGKDFQLGFLLTIVQNSIIPVFAGTRLPVSAIGYLDWGYNMASLPRIFVDSVGRVSFTSFSRIQEKRQLIARAAERAFQMLNLLTLLPIILVLIFGAEGIRHFVNERWLPAIVPLYWYIGSTYFLNANGILGHALLAIGKTKAVLIAGVIYLAIEITISYVLLMRIGFTGVAIGFFVSAIAMFIMYVGICFKGRINVQLKGIMLRDGIIFSVIFLFAYLINNLIAPSIYSLVLKLILTSLVYFTLFFFMAPHIVKQAIKLLLNSTR